MKFTVGLDYGTNSVRAVVVNVENGDHIASATWSYAHGDNGVIIDPKDPNLARQHPQDYIDGAERAVSAAIESARANPEFSVSDVIGVGVDTTGSTPMPVTKTGDPLTSIEEFGSNPAAAAWLWKDHTGVAEAEEITKTAEKMRRQYLAKCGGVYSSEWFWAKILHCLRTAPRVFEAAYTWVEIADWIPAVLTGTTDPTRLKRGICAAGHKAMFNPGWNGYPDIEFLSTLDPALGELRKTLPDVAYAVNTAAGVLTEDWARRTGLPAGIPVAVGAFDAHTGGIGSGIKPNVLVKNIGTSTCDMMVVPLDQELADIPGLCGIVPESILPGHYGLEAGQSAVGDIFNWYVSYIKPGGEETGTHAELTSRAEKLKPGESGLLALDWNNGNRTILVDQRLTGGLIGLTLHTRPEEIYRALVEATAFGARVIMERFEEYGQKVNEIVNCGGISVKNPMVMQIYADVMNRPLKISRSTETAALGSAIAGAVVAGADRGGYADFTEATREMTGTLPLVFTPDAGAARVYDRLYAMYRKLHDSFGTTAGADLYPVMKELIAVRDAARRGDVS